MKILPQIFDHDLNNRILVIDDNEMIHRDFEKILGSKAEQPENAQTFSDLEKVVYGSSETKSRTSPQFCLDFAFQGEEGLRKVVDSLKHQKPYAMAFVDVRMPPGWNGIETIKHLWEVDKDLLVVVCTAFSDHSFEDIWHEFGHTDQLMILKKPFDAIEILQFATSLCKKWSIKRFARMHKNELEKLVEAKTQEVGEHAANMAAIFENSPDAIFKVDRNLITTYCNHKTIDFDSNSLIGKSIRGLFSKGDVKKLLNACTHALNGEIPSDFESSWRKASSGTTRWFSNRIRFMKNDGLIESLLLVSTEITEKKLLEDKFRQAQKMEAVGRLAGGIAHDFNNLLTIQLGYADDALTCPKLSSGAKKSILGLRNASVRAASLTSQLLSFSRQHAIQPQKFNLNKLFSDLEPMLERIIREDIQLVVRLDEIDGFIYADKHQIEQVIINLAVNARDSMPSGGLLIIETCSSSTLPKRMREKPLDASHEANNFVMISVSDTGTGIHPDLLENIFEPFFTTKEQGKGTGLGLATVFSVVNQHDGYIDVSSDLDSGTTFEVYFPKASRIESSCKPARISSCQIDSGNESILVVEDENELRALFDLILKNAGYKVQTASHGLEALDLFNKDKNRFDFILTDVIMPKMGGKDLADKIKEIRPDIPVLFMSGYTRQAINRNGVIDAGIKFIQKPFTARSLLQRMRGILNGQDQ